MTVNSITPGATSLDSSSCEKDINEKVSNVINRYFINTPK
jgi:hypothetical protein